jgi:hypothetical protein
VWRGKIHPSLSGKKAYLNFELKDRDRRRLIIKPAVMPGLEPGIQQQRQLCG